MSDFHQNGIITDFHNLTRRSAEELEADLEQFARQRPLGLILPSLYSELEGPALDAIVETLSSADYLSEIVIGLDRADRDQFLRAREFFSRLPQHHRILWNDGPRLRELDADLSAEGLAPQQPGQGAQRLVLCGLCPGIGAHGSGGTARLRYSDLRPLAAGQTDVSRGASTLQLRVLQGLLLAHRRRQAERTGVPATGHAAAAGAEDHARAAALSGLSR